LKNVVSEALRNEVLKCIDVLNSGGTLLYPTDTIWGIGCDATSQQAVEKIYLIKRRMGVKSFIVLIDNASKLPLYVDGLPEITWDLLKNVTTPLTIIYPRGRNLAENILGNDKSVAIRIANHEFCRELIRAFGKPIVSTSANISGNATPCTFKDISPDIIRQTDYTVQLYHDDITTVKPSRIIKLYQNGEFNVIRP
jgi:L-threonylcarbamoyladenylate synthase